MTPIHVKREAMIAYECRTGFSGIGEYLEEIGAIKMTKRVNTCQGTSHN